MSSISDLHRIAQTFAKKFPAMSPVVQAQKKLMENFARMEQVTTFSNSNAFVMGNSIKLHYDNREMLAHLQISNKFSEMADAVRRFGDLHGRYMVMLIELGWVPVTALLPKEKRAMVEQFEAGDVEAVRKRLDGYFVGVYDADILYKMLERWRLKEQLLNRLPILESVIRSHLSSEYWCSIPALLPQIEGMTAQAKNHSGQLNGATLKKYYLEAVEGEELWFEVLRSFITTELLAHFGHGKEVDAELSRHAILHGADLDYGTAANSLKAILLFDYLQDLLFEVEDEEGRNQEDEKRSVV